MRKMFLPILVAAFGVSVGFSQTFTSGFWNYELDGSNEATIVGYFGPGGDVTIPAELDGYSVARVGGDSQVGFVPAGVFNYRADLTSVIISEGIRSIGYGTFQGCYGLTNVTMPSSVTSIGPFAFQQCSSLPSVIIPDSVTRIGESAFSMCASLTSVTISGSVASIGDNAFSSCTNLAEVTISAGITSIPRWAFSDCASLTSVAIPESVTSIGEGAFSSCASLTGITIPEGVTSIGGSAFYNCTSLSGVSLPETLVRIEQFAFQGCSGLSAITLPSSLEDIGDAAFFGCTSLSNVILPDGLISIGFFAFRQTALSEIVVPESVVWLGSEAFFQAPITNAVIPLKFVAQYGYMGLAPEISSSLFLAAMTNGLGIATKSDLGTATNNAIAQVQNSPNDYNLYDSTQYEANRITGVAQGKAEVTNNPTAYSLFTESSIMDMNMGGLMLKKGTNANELDLELTIETKDSLLDNEWQVTERIARKVSMDGAQRQFLRVRAGPPYVAPDVEVFAHPTLGNILTDASGMVLYFFSPDSAGGNPTYSGSAWPYVTMPEAPKADAGVTATLASSTFGRPDGSYLTVNGRPAYYYVGDSEAGQANGHGLGSVWWTVRADGVINQ